MWMENKINKFIKEEIITSMDVKGKFLSDNSLIKILEEISLKCLEVYKTKNKTLIAGNGGSAADAQHIAAEFVSRFNFDRPGLASLALTTDTSALTAIGNDYGYDKLFERQIQANGIKGDMFIGISTSGNSSNILNALKECKRRKIITVGLTGQDGGLMNQFCDYCIKVPSNNTPRIQETHILIGHIICAFVEEALFGKGF